jgi:uncharacterized integral membrane protein
MRMDALLFRDRELKTIVDKHRGWPVRSSTQFCFKTKIECMLSRHAIVDRVKGIAPRRCASQGRLKMRWFHLSVIAILAAATLIFAIQNLQSVTVAFLNFRLGLPLAVLIAIVYVLGMVTGGSLWAFFRWALEGSRRPVTS